MLLSYSSHLQYSFVFLCNDTGDKCLARVNFLEASSPAVTLTPVEISLLPVHERCNVDLGTGQSPVILTQTKIT
jgi:hypothetical protein